MAPKRLGPPAGAMPAGAAAGGGGDKNAGDSDSDRAARGVTQATEDGLNAPDNRVEDSAARAHLLWPMLTGFSGERASGT